MVVTLPDSSPLAVLDGDVDAARGSDAETVEYCPFPQLETSVSDWESLTLKSVNELQRALRWLAKKFATISLSDIALDPDSGDNEKALEFYSNPQFLKDSSLFYRPIGRLPHVCISRPHPLTQGEVVDLSFASRFQPVYAPFREEYERFPENHLVHARYWRHPKGQSLGTMIAVHGWFMGDQRVNAVALVPGYFYRLGLDVVLYELPYHGRRSPQGTNQQMSLFPSSNVARTNEAIAQAIFDLRSIAAWLKEENELPIGVSGISLGGYAASLWASLDELAFALPMVPLVSMAELAHDVLEGYRQNHASDAEMFQAIGLEQLRRAYAVHSPLNYQPKLPPERRMILAGLADKVIPDSQPRSLWEHWNKPRMHWFEGGHLGDMMQASALAEVHSFLRSLNLAYEEPLSILPR